VLLAEHRPSRLRVSTACPGVSTIGRAPRLPGITGSSLSSRAVSNLCSAQWKVEPARWPKLSTVSCVSTVVFRLRTSKGASARVKVSVVVWLTYWRFAYSWNISKVSWSSALQPIS
jgi:hypothetical protein